MPCFNHVFLLSRVFTRVLDAFTRVLDNNMSVSKTRVKTQENYPTQGKRKNIFLYYTMRLVKTPASCVFLVFFLVFWNV